MLLDKKTQSTLTTYVPDRSLSERLASYYTAFSDGSRLRILCALSISSMCVNDLAETLKMNQTTLSHQLRLLRGMDIVSACRQGKIILYSISDKKTVDCLMYAVDFLTDDKAV